MDGKKTPGNSSSALTAELVATPDATGALPLVRKAAYKLRDLRGVRREIARAIAAARVGVLPAEEASRHVYMLSQLAKVISDTLLEERVRRLERVGSGDS